MSENNKKDFEEDIYKDAPGLDTDLEWEEEAYYLDLIYKSIDDELCDSTEITDNGLEIKNGVLLHYHGTISCPKASEYGWSTIAFTLPPPIRRQRSSLRRGFCTP